MDSISITDTGSYRWRLEAINPVGTVTWGRDVTGAQSTLGTGPVLVDAAPFNLPVTYYATDDSGTTVAAPVTYSSTLPVLSSQTTDDAYAVTVLSQDEMRHEAQSRAHNVIGRPDPLVTILPALYPTGDLVLWTGTLDGRRDLIVMLATGSPLLLRSTHPERVQDMVLLPTEWSDALVNPDRPGGPRTLTISYQAVTDLRGYGPPADRTYNAWLIDHADYAAVRDAYSTYQAARDGAA